MPNWIQKKIINKLNTYKTVIKYYFFIKNTPNENGIYFFFPFYHVGGAERVHIDIVNTTLKKSWVFFTGESENEAFLKEFKSIAKCFYKIPLQKKKFKILLLKSIASNINNNPKAIVFGCNSHYFYELIPYLGDHVKCIDLIHAFNHKHEIGAEDWSLPFVHRLNKRVFISHKAIRDLNEMYVDNLIPSSLMDRVVFICNKVNVPQILIKERKQKLKVIYVGRGTSEKRVHLIGKIAKQCSDLGLALEFASIGNNRFGFNKEDEQYINFLGEINSQMQMEKIYKEAHIILISSSREGFPMAIMEAMAFGLAPVSTNVGDIPFHIKDNINGCIVNAEQGENMIIENFVEKLKTLSEEPELWENISQNAYKYARENFSEKQFVSAYRNLLSYP